MPANARRVLTFYKFLELAEPDKERDEVEGFGD